MLVSRVDFERKWETEKGQKIIRLEVMFATLVGVSVSTCLRMPPDTKMDGKVIKKTYQKIDQKIIEK